MPSLVRYHPSLIDTVCAIGTAIGVAMEPHFSDFQKLDVRTYLYLPSIG